MNPYTYGKHRAAAANKASSSGIGSWMNAIFNAPVHSAIAFLFVLFAASSVAGMAAMAYPEIATAVDPSPQVAMAHAPFSVLGYSSGKVLGDSTTSIRVGQLVNDPNGTLTIYLVGSTALYPFNNTSSYNSWYPNFNNIVTANSAELALPISSTFVPTKLSGCSSPLDQINGTCGGTSSAGSVRVGQLVYNPSATTVTVYLVAQSGLYGIPTLAVFNSWGWSFTQVVQANSAELALSQVGIVPMMQPGCSNPLSQIAGTCGTSLNIYDVNGDGVVNSIDFYNVAESASNPTSAIAITCGMKCDMTGTGNGTANQADVVAEAKYISTLSPNPFDLNGDGKVDANDLIKVLDTFDKISNATCGAQCDISGTGNGVPNLNDIILEQDYLKALGISTTSMSAPSVYDVNGDGKVNAADFFLVDSLSKGNSSTCGLKCDVNGDGVVNAADVAAEASYIQALPGANPFDVNGDGVVNANDLILVLQVATNAPGATCGPQCDVIGSNGGKANLNDVILEQDYLKVLGISTTSTAPSLAIMAPATGTVLTTGSQYTFTWTSVSWPSTVNLSLVQNGTYLAQIASGVPNSGSYVWTVPSNYSGSGFALYVSAPGELPVTGNAFSIAAATAQAPIVLTNPSFENSSCGSRSATPVACGPVSWTQGGNGQAGAFLPSTSDALQAFDGLQYGYANASSSLIQAVSTLQPNTTYTFTVWVANRTNPSTGFCAGCMFDPVAQLVAGGTVLGSATGPTPAVGAWAEWSLRYTSPASGSLIGQTLSINLSAAANQGDFDDVALQAVSAAPVVSTPPTQTSQYDYNNDGKVDQQDYTILLDILNKINGYTSCPTGKTCDINGDGVISLNDLFAFPAQPISLSPKSLSFSFVQGGFAPPSQTINVSNVSSLGITVTQTAASPLVTFGPITYSGTSASFTVSLSSAGLALASGTTNYSFELSGAGLETAVPVNITVAAPAVSLSVSGISPSSASVGSQVTINGTGFSATGNYVDIGGYGIPNQNSTNNGTAITITVPPVSVGNNSVTVTPYLGAQSAPVNFTVTH